MESKNQRNAWPFLRFGGVFLGYFGGYFGRIFESFTVVSAISHYYSVIYAMLHYFAFFYLNFRFNDYLPKALLMGTQLEFGPSGRS